VGMGTLFAGFLRVPITSVFMVVEVTGNYSIILPVMISNLLAYFISRRYQEVPLFDVLSRQDGMVLPSLEEVREQRMLRVEDGMRRPLPPLAKPQEIAREVLKRCAGSPDEYILVSEIDGTWRLVTVEELKRVRDTDDGEGIVAEAALAGPVPVVYPDQPLEEALRDLHEWPFLPVGSRVRTDHVHGVISLRDALEAYRES
jgi:CIC family chloride channel protein